MSPERLAAIEAVANAATRNEFRAIVLWDVPLLIAEIRRLESVISQLETDLDDAGNNRPGYAVRTP